jgi:hypothetical protein
MSKDTFAPPKQYREAKKTIEDTQKRLYEQAEKAVNQMTRTDQFCLSCHCVHGGTCPPHEARTTGVAGLQESFRAACEEIVRLKDERDALGKAIWYQAVKTGNCDDDVSLTGPALVMLVSDMGSEITQLRTKNAEIERLKDHLTMVESWLDSKQDSIDHHIAENAQLRAELAQAKGALEKALAIIYSWAIDGHAGWCELDPGCTCGHSQAQELHEKERGK